MPAMPRIMITWRDKDGLVHELVPRTYLGGAHNPVCTSGYRLGPTDEMLRETIRSAKKAVKEAVARPVTCLWCAVGNTANVNIVDD